MRFRSTIPLLALAACGGKAKPAAEKPKMVEVASSHEIESVLTDLQNLDNVCYATLADGTEYVVGIALCQDLDPTVLVGHRVKLQLEPCPAGDAVCTSEQVTALTDLGATE